MPEEPNYRILIDQLAQSCRVRYGWTMDDIAAKVGLNANYFKYEAQRTPGKLKRTYLAIIGLIALENQKKQKETA